MANKYRRAGRQARVYRLAEQAADGNLFDLAERPQGKSGGRQHAEPCRRKQRRGINIGHKGNRQNRTEKCLHTERGERAQHQPKRDGANRQ